MENKRKKLYCKGTVPGTSFKCRAELCETDGEWIYFRSNAGNEVRYKKTLAVRQHDIFRLVCENCGFENERKIKKTV